jgi:YVTN family beta-propeller protein
VHSIDPSHDRRLAIHGGRTRPRHRRLRSAGIFAAIACVTVATATAGTSLAFGSAPARSAAMAQAHVARYGLPQMRAAGPGTLQAPADRASSDTIALSGSAGGVVADPRTNTVYVPIQCPTGACATVSHVVDVINSAKCNIEVKTDCRVVARAKVGANPIGAAVDQTTDTLYTADGAGTVSVVNGARCNAKVTSGCAQPVAIIKVGGFLVAAAFDPATRTLYVANPNGGVFVIDARQCSAVTSRGCGRAVKAVTDSAGPDGLDVDVATDTVYAANSGPNGQGDTVSVINGASCNASHASGCSQTPRTVTVGTNPYWDAVDQATNTVYVANYNSGTVSVINGARCNGRVSVGCARTPPQVPTGAETTSVVVDDPMHTVFALNQGDDTLSAINTRTCKGTVTFACVKHPRDERAVPDHGPRFVNFPPNFFAILPQTQTAYMVNAGGVNYLSLVSVRGCTATAQTTCRVEAPHVARPEFSASLDPATDTLYESNTVRPDIDVVNGATCNTRDRSGCAPVAEIPVRDPDDLMGAIDQATDTLYAADQNSDTVLVIDTATCNARHTAGCAASPPTITVGADPGPPIVNQATGTLYVAFSSSATQDDRDRVAVVNAAACNAGDISGCGQTPGVVDVAAGTSILGLSVATDTIYAADSGISTFDGDTVSVIDGATCNRSERAGCGHLAAIVKVGLGPYGVAVDDLTHTVYVADNFDGDAPGRVSVINGATCNGSDTTGCARLVATVGVGQSPLLAVVDTRTDVVYVGDYTSAGLSVLDGARCNASVTVGCRAEAPEDAVGSQPFGLALDQTANTIYTMNTGSTGSVSIVKGSR